MRLNKFVLVSMILLAVISLGAVSAASDATADDTAVGVTEELDLGASDVEEISTSGDDIAIGSDVIKDGDALSAGSVTPNYTIEVTPDVKDAGNNYVAQYGQVITVSGIFENVTGNITITFGYSGNYHDFNVPLVDGKFSQDITCYDRVRNNYQIQVKYAGDDYYKSVSWSKNIHVQMENVTANGAYYGLAAYMDINMFDATGNVTCVVNDEVNYTYKLENGKLYIEIRNYTVGKNYVDFIYHGDDRFNPIEKSFTFDVKANIRAPTIYNYEEAIVEVYFGEATGKATISLGNETHELDIVDGKVATEIENYKVGNNTLDITYSGDSTFNPFKTTAILTVLDKEDATIISSVYQTASQNFIFINVPHATGNITVTVNGKEEEWELVNGTVKKDIAPSDVINELKVSYAGNVRLNPTTSSFYVNLTDYIVNNKTFRNYFDLSNDGKLYDFLEDGITLDFQGIVFINPVSENEVNIEISKPINIISSTNDAYIDLNTTAGSLLGEHPGSSFIVGRAGSGSNISGIYLHNTELWISNTTNVVFDNISVVVEDQRVGSGVGATSVRDNSSYVTIKNSYFYTRNNGGSTTFTFSWATYCVFDNNTVKVEGNVGNMLYLNVYNIKNLPEPTKTSWGDVLPNYPLNNHNAFINNRLYGKEGSAISVGIMVEGEYNLIANNTLNKTSISTSFGGTGANHNTYYGNILMQGSGLTAQTESIIYDNYVPGTLATGSNSVAYDNIAGKMTVTAGSTAFDNEIAESMTVAANSFAYNNTVNGTMTVSGANAIASQNTVDAMTVSGAGANVGKNTIHIAVTVSGNNVIFAGNVIGTPENNGALSASALDVVGDSGSLKVTGKNDTIVNNFIYGEASITGANTVFDSNIVTDVVTVSSNDNEIIGNEITTKGDYAIDLTSSSGNTVEYNRLISADKKGDDAVKSEGDNDVEKNMAQKIMTIDVSDCWAIQNNNITITVPGATGNVTVKVNNKEYVEVPLVDGKVIIEVSSDDMEVGLNEVAVTYNGDASIDPDSDYALFTVFDDTVTPNTFYAYFDENGILRSNVPYDEITFQGTFENLTDYIIINRPISIDGYRVKFINMGMVIGSENVTVEDLVFEADKSLGDLIGVYADNVEISWVEINYVVGDEDACAIAIDDAENVLIYRCEIYFESNITSDDKESYAINVLESENVVINRNEIIARLPGLVMKTYDWSYFGMGLAYVNGVRIYESEGVNFTSNELDVAYSRIVDESYPDVQAMIVAGSTDVLIDGNEISVIDTLVKAGKTMGIVGIQFIGNDAVTVSDNEIYISTQGGVSSGGTAYPITVIGTSIDIIDNEIYTESNGPNLAIYMPMGFAAGKLVNIVGNDIDVVGNTTAKNNNWALISAVEVQAGSANIYENEITVYNKAGYNETYAVTGVSMYQSGYSSVVFDIQNNTIITNGKTTVYIPNGKSANVTGNALYAEELFGDASVDSKISGVVENNTPPFEPVIEILGGGWTGLDGFVTVTVKGVIGIPYISEGNVTIKVGNKTFKDLQLVNGTVTQTVEAKDLVFGSNLVTVTYTGDKYILPGEATGNLEVVGGVITNETFFNYFDKDNNNYLYDFIPEGATLDFQGLFVGANYSLYINKPVNIISSTGDAFFDSGANPNRNWIKFNIVEGANHTNLTGLKFLNSDLFVIGASYVTIDDVNMVAKMSGVGSGTGFLSIHSNAYYTVVKNSFFENGGTGSSILVLGKGGKYATFDNNEFLITGSSGNILSSNIYVGKGEIPQCVNYTNNFINNTVGASGFCYGITVCGEGNLIENNTLYHKGAGIITQYGANTAGNVYRNNKLYNGCTMSVGDNSIVENNYVEAGLTIAPGVKAYNNTAKTMTISGANAVVEGNIAGATTISGSNVTFAFNDLSGLLTVSSSGNTIEYNTIESGSTYAVDLQNSANNTVTNNVLYGNELFSNDAVKFVEGKGNVVEDNYPVDPELEVTVDDINIGEDAIIKVSMANDINDEVLVVVDAKLYIVPVSAGKGQLNVSGLAAGKYSVSAMFKGDLKYIEAIAYTSFNVDKALPIINIEISDAVLGNDVTVTVTMADATGVVAIIVDDDVHFVALEEGKANYTVIAPEAGEHSIVVFYDGDDKFESNFAVDSFELYDFATQFTNITIDNNMIIAYLFDETGDAVGDAPIKCIINGIESIMKTSADGSVIIGNVADSTVELIFEGATPLLASNITINLKNIAPIRTATQLFADNFTQYSCDYVAGEKGGYFKVQIKDVNGNPLANKTIAVGYNGIVGYYQSDAEGWIQKQIALQNAGEYTFASVFVGDDDYTASFIVNKLTIVKKPTSISASAKSYKASASKKSYTVTLKTIAGSSIDGKVYLSAGKKITFKVNGKTYTAKTDSKGKATVNLKLTKKGKYTLKVSFAGDNAYKSSTKSVKITIK